MEILDKQVVEGVLAFEAMIRNAIGTEKFSERLASATQNATIGGRLFRDSRDRIFWYLALYRALKDNNFLIYNMHEGARIVPVLASIAMKIDKVKRIRGIGSKIVELCNPQNDDVDTVLFELLVAANYIKDGIDVGFIDTMPNVKTPDILVQSRESKTYVECKKLQRANDYAYLEVDMWYRVADALAHIIAANRIAGWFDFEFTRELVGLNPARVLRKISRKLHRIKFADKKFCVARNLDFNVMYTPIDKELLGVELDPLRNVGGPSFVNYLTKSYDVQRGYKVFGEFSFDPAPFVSIAHFAAVFSWRVTGYSAITKKAQHVKRRLVDAIKQLGTYPDRRIHILVEECSGASVYERRLQKNFQNIMNTNPGESFAGAVYLHVAKYLVPLDMSFDVEETVFSFGYDSSTPESFSSCWFYNDTHEQGIGTLFDDHRG